MRYSSCVSRFITRRVVLSCWLAVCLLCGLSVAVVCCPMGTLCAGRAVLCAARGRAGICLFCWSVSFRGAVWCWCVAVCGVVLPWCCPVCWSTVCASSSARHALTCCYCPTAFTFCRLSVLRSAIRHPFGARLFRLRRARSAYLAILYHYRHFHNYLMITVTYNLSDNGILSSVRII